MLLGDIYLDGVDFFMKTYRGEENDNMAVFIDSFDDGEPRDSLDAPFLLKAKNIYLNDMHYRLIDANKEDSLNYEAFNAGGSIQNFQILGPEVSANIKGLYLVDMYGLQVTNLTTDFEYSKTAMHFKNTLLETPNSTINAELDFTYKREDLADFNNKVQIDGVFKKASISIIDAKKFYSELNGDDILNFNGLYKGTINEFDLKNLRLKSKKGLEINGDLAFINTINKDRGFIFQGELNKVSATYPLLKNVLPNVLGNTLPTEFIQLGRFSLSGNIKVTPNQIIAIADIDSEIGKAITDLQISNIENIDYAEYQGDVQLINFEMGTFFKDPLFGKLSLKGDVNGSGFKLDNIDTKFIGKISKFNFNDYEYKNIIANGKYENNKFDGDLEIDDENFKMTFEGLADLSSEIYKFDFESNIAFLDLKKTNLFTRDSTANVKGKIEIDIEGNTFDDIIGSANFRNVFYTNEKQEFTFKEFNVTSSIKDNVKTIKVDSKEIAKGYLEGKFTFDEVVKVSQNALGSIYTNYRPYDVAPNQYLDFDFVIYNQIVNVFFPDIFIDNNTKIKGKIDANKNDLKLTFSSPKINFFGNELKDILLRTDNKNPLYNSHLTASEVDTEYYKVSKFNLLNRTQNDTLFFKSTFEGGDKSNEDFNLDFYYTINENQKSVIGFEDSKFVYRDVSWDINPDKKNTDKIVFDLKTNEYDFSNFLIKSNQQKIEFSGNIQENKKSFLVNLTKVKLASILPEIDSLSLKGEVSGELDFVQNGNDYKPEASLIINDFQVNKFDQGNLAINIKGKNSYEKFDVDLSINNENVKSIAAVGELDFTDKRPLIDLEVFLEDYQIGAFSPLGKDVISSIRGKASGQFDLKGFLGNPDMEGTLYLNDAGLKFPYLNVDFDFDGESTITLSEQSFIFENLQLLDTKYGTKGQFLGNITHRNFDQWFLDFEIVSDNLLVLDTKNTEESLYYGTAFMDGSVNITGLTDQIDINVNAKTNPNTTFIVPLKDIETVDSYRLIYFKTKDKKIEEQQRQNAKEALEGLSLNIDLEVTKDALAQVVIDEENGSQLTGRGNGNLQIDINTRGVFNMYGDYTIDNGIYDFKYGGIINKPFIIQKGGVISWSGDPFEANLDVTAIYKANANPGVLLTNYNSNRREEIDLVTRITGGLFSSKQELDIQLNNVDPTIASELEFVLNDNNVNEKTTQFISLLAFGTFRNPDNANFDVNNTITGTASSALAAAFSNILNSPDSKFQLGLDYQQGDNGNDIDRLNIDNQVDVSVSTQLSDRVIINGKVGVPVGGQAQTSIVGEVKVEILLNEEGNFRGIIFNRQNEIQFSQQEEGYTQGVGLSYQVNFNTLSELLEKVGLKKEEKIKKKTTAKKDSFPSKHKSLINFEGN